MSNGVEICKKVEKGHAEIDIEFHRSAKGVINSKIIQKYEFHRKAEEKLPRKI